MLRPQDSSTRERKSLNGLWDFRLDSEREGRAARWFSQSLPDSRQMAVQQSCASAATKRASSLVIASQRPQRTRCAAAGAKIFEEVTGQRQSHLCQARDVDLMGILRDTRELEAKCCREAA